VIARQLGVTPRYVHSLLEETGKSFRHHVLEHRLEKAAALLRDPCRQSCRIADIAGEVVLTICRTSIALSAAATASRRPMFATRPRPSIETGHRLGG